VPTENEKVIFMIKAIATSVDITPSQALVAAGHCLRDVPSRKVAIPFEANVLGLRENGQTLIIVSVDWFFASPGLRERILTRCAGRLDKASLVVAASHAHTSPNPDRTKVGFGRVNLDYVAWAERTIANRIGEMLHLGDWHPARLRFTTTACDCAIHRRRKIWWPEGFRLRHVISMFPNATGPRDRELRLLRVEDQDDSLMAVIWGVSCHPTEWPVCSELSSDYPGGVRQALRARIGSEVPVVFLQGFCGDLRPPSIGRWQRRGRWRSRLLNFAFSFVNGPPFAGFTPGEYRAWMKNIGECAERALNQAAHSTPLVTKLSIQRTGIDLSALGLSGEITELIFHSFELDEKIRVVGISAEVCWEWMDLVQRAFAGKTIWPVGYIDRVFGYLPTQAMLPEGGYEVTEFQDSFGIKGEFVANLDEIITKLISDQQIYEKLEAHPVRPAK
jgi:neutral ceramidase